MSDIQLLFARDIADLGIEGRGCEAVTILSCHNSHHFFWAIFLASSSANEAKFWALSSISAVLSLMSCKHRIIHQSTSSPNSTQTQEKAHCYAFLSGGTNTLIYPVVVEECALGQKFVAQLPAVFLPVQQVYV